MNDPKILVYGNLDKLKKNMNGHFLDQLSLVGYEITQKPENIKELNNYIKENEFTHLLIPDENFHNLNQSLEDCIVPVVELLGDHWVPWAIERKKQYILENRIKNVIVFTDRFLEPYKGIAKFYNVLPGFDSSTFRDEEQEREIDILISGSMGKDTYPWVYPVRNWLSEVLPDIANKEGLKIEFLSHPGYETKEKKTEEYSKIINRSKIATGGSSKWRLVLKKLYEIPACGTILLTDIPLDDSNFFKDNVIKINPNKILSSGYTDNLRRRIMDALEHYEDKKIRLQPFKDKKNKFQRSYEGRAIEIRSIIESI